jgi:hypothetical protein
MAAEVGEGTAMVERTKGTTVVGVVGRWTVVLVMTAFAKRVLEDSTKRRNSVKSLYEMEAPARFVNSKSIRCLE